MLYTEQELEAQKKDYGKRLRTALIPPCVVFVLAVALFIAGQLMRNDSIWIITVLMTIASGAWLIFFLNVSVKPSRVYINNMDYLLHGDRKKYDGILKTISEEKQDREGLLCRAVMLNVGEKDDPKDDRLLYWDYYKAFPEELLGKRVHAESNNNVIAELNPIA